jgi:hypothetical protein
MAGALRGAEYKKKFSEDNKFWHSPLSLFDIYRQLEY